MAAQSRLLKTTRIILRIATFLNWAFIALAVAVLAVFWWFADKIPVDATGNFGGMDLSGPAAIKIAAIGLTAGAAISVLMLIALRSVLRIVDSTIEGDPFAHENGGRWAQVGWLGLGIQVINVGAAAAVRTTVPEFPSGPSPVGSLTGFLMVLLIFVVAQIFRRGSEMRAELEGTV